MASTIFFCDTGNSGYEHVETTLAASGDGPLCSIQVSVAKSSKTSTCTWVSYFTHVNQSLDHYNITCRK